MEWWKALILGLVQGFTEFLPVSSSGHLVLVQEWLNVQSNNIVFFDIMLHVATLVAVCAVLYKEIWKLLKNIISKPVLLLIIATIPAGIIGVTLDDVIEGMFEGTKYLWIFFIISAIVLFISDLMGNYYRKKQAEKAVDSTQPTEQVVGEPLFKSINYSNAIIMGCAQACAVFPGITRSGSTIAAGVIAKGDRKEVAKFSFLMSIPVILASALLHSIKMIKAPAPIDIPVFSIIIGMVAAAISGYVAVKWMIKLVEKCQLKWFSIYLLLLAIVIIVNNFVKIW